jgi:hypothetical protein
VHGTSAPNDSMSCEGRLSAFFYQGVETRAESLESCEEATLLEFDAGLAEG